MYFPQSHTLLNWLGNYSQTNFTAASRTDYFQFIFLDSLTTAPFPHCGAWKYSNLLPDTDPSDQTGNIFGVGRWIAIYAYCIAVKGFEGC